VRLEDSGKVIGGGLRFFRIASCPCGVRIGEEEVCVTGLSFFFFSFPQGVVGGGRGGKTV
jgi:hypothetical protein